MKEHFIIQAVQLVLGIDHFPYTKVTIMLDTASSKRTDLQ